MGSSAGAGGGGAGGDGGDTQGPTSGLAAANGGTGGIGVANGGFGGGVGVFCEMLGETVSVLPTVVFLLLAFALVSVAARTLHRRRGA